MVKAHNHHHGRVFIRETIVVSIVEVNLRPDRVLEPPASAKGLRELPSETLHFWVLFTDVTPALLRKVNLMSQAVFSCSLHAPTESITFLLSDIDQTRDILHGSSI